ncbi:MAG: amidohydrolase [Candidatus Hydrogenedentes bacterium]|nr:amidohydrolase [Candidatus Hydrogenedentota bacterium]
MSTNEDLSLDEGVSRRQFLASTTRGAVGFAVGAALTLEATAQEQVATPAAGKYIDVHTHVGQQWGNRLPLSGEDLLRWMDSQGIMKAIVLSLISPESFDYVVSVDFTLKETAPHRDRLIPFCTIDPRTEEHNTVEKKVKMLKKYVDAGARGFGEHKCGTPIDDPRSLEIYAACSELKLPLLFHMDNIRNTDVPGLPGLEKALASAPDAIFIGHAQGWWASISGDMTQEMFGTYPKGKIAPGGAIDTLMDKYPNLYGDLSAGSGANALTRDPEFAREFLIRRQDRLMFGTDYLAPKQEIPQFDVLGKIDLPEDVRKKIYVENAARVLGL